MWPNCGPICVAIDRPESGRYPVQFTAPRESKPFSLPNARHFQDSPLGQLQPASPVTRSDDSLQAMFAAVMQDSPSRDARKFSQYIAKCWVDAVPKPWRSARCPPKPASSTRCGAYDCAAVAPGLFWLSEVIHADLTVGGYAVIVDGAPIAERGPLVAARWLREHRPWRKIFKGGQLAVALAVIGGLPPGFDEGGIEDGDGSLLAPEMDLALATLVTYGSTWPPQCSQPADGSQRTNSHGGANPTVYRAVLQLSVPVLKWQVHEKVASAWRDRGAWPLTAGTQEEWQTCPRWRQW